MQSERSSRITCLVSGIHHRTGLSTCTYRGPVKETRKKHKKPDSLVSDTQESRKLAATNENRA